MTLPIRTLALSALAAATPAAAQDVRDYQLPPGPTPTEANRAQGPVDPDAPVPLRPRAIPTAAATTPTPTPSATPTAALILPTPLATPPRSVPSGTPTAAVTRAPAPSPPLPTEISPQPLPEASAPAAAAPVTAGPVPTHRAPAATPTTEWPWPWIAGGGAVVVGLATLVATMVRRRRVVPETIAPFEPTAAAPPSNADSLAMVAEAVRLDRSLMNATVGYRITLRNRGARALGGIAVEADLVSASRDLPPERQLASPDHALPVLHAADRLGPGQSLRFEGQVRLPLAQASLIWQGRVGLLVPLLRVRVTAEGAETVASTLVIGTGDGATARPQPFRLDEPPRSYAPLAQRVLDPVPLRA